MATDLNRVILIGRLTRDAELKYTASGQAVCKFSIAVNRNRKNGDQWVEEASFFDIVLWGRTGEALNQHLIKGKMVGIDGELRQDRWQQDGQNRSKVEIIANNIQLLSRNDGQQASAQSGGGSWPQSGQDRSSREDQGSQESAPPPAGDDFADDIPF
ncbi:MAG: single-stranded DNA-binding protein [Treponema sp.]|nr:single-stranded DNA-binding protein [Treponema sp.]